MAKVVCGMTLSLDGFVQDSAGSAGRLYEDIESLHDSEYMREWEERTGAVLMGARTFNMALDSDFYAEGYEFQGPLFVVTTHPPAKHPKENEHLTITFVTDGLESALVQAKRAAGEKDVSVIGGPMVIRALLRMGIVDELAIDFVPVLLGSGLSLLGDIDDENFRLETIRVSEVGQRVSIQYRVVNKA